MTTKLRRATSRHLPRTGKSTTAAGKASKRQPAPPVTPRWVDTWSGNVEGQSKKPGKHPAKTVVAYADTVTTTISADSAKLAATLTIPGGTGNATDVTLVAADVAKVPAEILERAKAVGIKVVACRDSVTDYCTELKGVTPRGWPPGSTWDSVPGLYEPSRKAVVVATRAGATADAPRHVPVSGEGEGAYDLFLHEFAHSLDYRHALTGVGSSSGAFLAAYAADKASLTAHQETYLLQPGKAGQEECFAETFDRFYAGDPALKEELPNLYAYWTSTDNKLTGGAQQ
jgi:hypothetical protein